MSSLRGLGLSFVSTMCLFGLATPAVAQEPEIIVTARMNAPEGFETVKLVVGISDLDLATTTGATRMERRVSESIKRFCGPPARAARWEVKDSKLCSEHAWASARPQMDEALRKARGN
ncbi:MAG: UrcA family protein [Erythrobacter sp.]